MSIQLKRILQKNLKNIFSGCEWSLSISYQIFAASQLSSFYQAFKCKKVPAELKLKFPTGLKVELKSNFLAELKLKVPAELKLKVPAELKVELKMSRV